LVAIGVEKTAASSAAAVAWCAVPGSQVIFRSGFRRAFAVFRVIDGMIGRASHVGISALGCVRLAAQGAFLPCGSGGRCGHLAFLAHALELAAVLFLVDELSGFLVTLGEVFLTHHLGGELRPLADGAVAVTVTGGCVGGHDFLLCCIGAVDCTVDRQRGSLLPVPDAMRRQMELGKAAICVLMRADEILKTVTTGKIAGQFLPIMMPVTRKEFRFGSGA
jgi:hypothetical protein